MQVNQIRAGAALSYVSMALSTVISLVYTPIMLRQLGDSEFGVYQAVLPIISYLNLLSFGLGSAYVRYYSRFRAAGDKKGCAKLNGMFLITYLILGALVLAIGFGLSYCDVVFGKKLTAEEIDLAQRLLRIMSVNAALTFPISVFESHVTINERYLFQKIVAMGKQVLNPLIMIPLLLIGYRSVTLTIVSLIFTVLSGVINITYCLTRLKMPFAFRHYDFALLREMFGFTLYVFIGIVVDNINWSIDRQLLTWFHGSAAVTVYVIASQLNNYFLLFGNAISNVMTPRVHRLVAENAPMQTLDALFTKVGRLQFILLGGIFLGFVAIGQSFVVLWGAVPHRLLDRIAAVLCLPVDQHSDRGHRDTACQEYAQIPFAGLSGRTGGQHRDLHPPVYEMAGPGRGHRHGGRHAGGQRVPDEPLLLQAHRPEHSRLLAAYQPSAAGHGAAHHRGGAAGGVRPSRHLLAADPTGTAVRGGVRRQYVAVRHEPL